MVKRIIKFIGREVENLHAAAYLLGAFALISQIFGFIRDRLLASQFGAGPVLDTYYAAFRIPDLLFTLISTLVSLSVLVPFIIRFENKSEEEKTEFSNTVFTIVAVTSLFLTLVVLIISRPLLTLMFPSIVHSVDGDNLVLLTRVMLLQPVILAFSSFYASYIQVYKKFFIYALSPVLYNIGIVIGIIALYPMFGMVGLAMGVVLGALLHLFIQIPTIREKGPYARFTLYPNLSIVKDILILSVPRTFALAGNQITQIVLLVLAGSMISGSISIFSLSFNLQSVPLAIIGVSYSLAAFPTLSRLFNNGDMENFVKHIARVARHIIFWSIPVMVMFIILRAQIVRTVFGGGEFDWNDTKLTSAALAIFSLSVVAQSLTLLFVRGYYSAGETKKPLIFAVISIAVTIFSAITLVHIFNINEAFRYYIGDILRVADTPGVVVLMLPLAFSFGQLINTLLLWISFDHKYRWFSDALWKTIFHSVSASVIAGAVTVYILRVLGDVLNLNTLLGVFSQGLISGLAGISCGAFFLFIIKNEEIMVILHTLNKKIFKTNFIGGE